MAKKSVNYDENSIEVLEGLQAVRVRPGMYIGNLAQGQLQITKEVLDNGIDECLAGYSKKVHCIITDSYIQVMDEGRGIPVGIHPKYLKEKKSTLEVIMTQLHAGGKIKEGAYNNGSIGVNGVGVSCCNALSSYFQVWTYREKKWWTQTFEKGNPTSKVHEGNPDFKWKQGTIVRFTPDTSIIPNPIDIKMLAGWFRNNAFLNPGIEFTLNYKGKEKTYKSEGLTDYIKWKTKDLNSEPLYKPFICNTENVNVVLQWFESDEGDLSSWCNTSPTLEGGTHLNALLKVIAKAFDNAAKKKNYRPEDLRTGLFGALNIRISTPQFDSQTKEKLINPEAEKLVYDQVFPEFEKYLNSNKAFVKKVIDRANSIRSIYNKFNQEKKALSKLKSRGKVNLPPANKFISCNCKDAEVREIFICLEGDTEIRDINNNSYKIKDLVGKEIIGFGIDMKTREIRPSLLRNIRKTRENAELVRVHLDNGNYIDCTPDHRFVCKQPDRQKGFKIWYKEAKDLVVGQSLVHLEIRQKDYLEYYQPINGYKTEKVHQQVASYYIPGYQGSEIQDIHHINENKIDNYPTNLKLLGKDEHSKLHKVLPEYWKKQESREIQSKKVKNYFSNEENRKKTSDATKRRMQKVDFTKIRECNKIYGKYRAEKRDEYLIKRTKEELKKFLDGKDYKYLRGNTLNLRTYFVNDEAFYNYYISQDLETLNLPEKTNKERILQIANLCYKKFGNCKYETLQNYCKENGIQKPLMGNILKSFKNFEEIEELAKVYNLKVTKIEKLNYKRDVYCLKSDTGNFFLSCGICAKNCEGDSAAGTARQARNPYNQEILKLRGKILNVAKTGLTKAYESEDILNILKGIGFDPTSRERQLRVGKIIILTDADVDGAHISVLLLTLFQKLYPEVIEKGMVYTVDAPLFVGKTETKEYYGETLVDLKQQYSGKFKSVTRIKGWGEASNFLLKKFAFDPMTRKLQKITAINDKELKYFYKIVGEDTETRKKILENT